MGFAAADQAHKAASVDRREILQFVEPEDLLGFGFIPEFIGRLPMVTVLEDYSTILKKQGKAKEAEELRVEAKRARVASSLVINAHSLQ